MLTRDAIIDATISLMIQQKQLGQPSLRAIARSVDHTASAIYYYFTSKADLFFAVSNQLIINALKAAKAHCSQSLIIGLIHYWHSHKKEFELIFLNSQQKTTITDLSAYRELKQQLSPMGLQDVESILSMMIGLLIQARIEHWSWERVESLAHRCLSLQPQILSPITTA